MKITEIIQKIEAYHPQVDGYEGCDGIKSGNPDVECTGVVCAIVPTMEVIRACIRLGANFLYVHEPSYYMTPDYPQWRGDFPNQVYEEKRALLEEHNIVIYRDHDHAHMHQPDSIFTGVIKYLGWEPYYERDNHDVPMGYAFHIPPTTVGDLGKKLIEDVGLHGMRFIGNPKDVIERVAIVGHLFPDGFGETIETETTFTDYSTEIIRAMEVGGIQAIIPGEVIEWNVLSYIRDGVEQGRPMACFNMGHFSFEQLGLKFAKDWIDEILGGAVSVTYVDTGDIWNFM